MSRAEAIVAAARGWIGTPYRHQASARGAGCDCLGLVRGVWREVIGPEPESVPPYSRDWSEPQGDERLWRAAAQWLRPLPRVDPGDTFPGEVVLMRMRDGAVAKHLGIAARRDGAPSLIHAYGGRAVVESALGPAWRRRIVARFAFPQETD